MAAPELAALLALGDEVIDGVARRAPGVVGECVVRAGAELAARVRLGATVAVEERATRTVGLRVVDGARAAMVSTSDVSPAGLAALVADALELVQVTEPDPSIGAVDAAQSCDAAAVRELELYDPAVAAVDSADAVERARQAEAAALATDARITGSDGATCRRTHGAIAYVLGERFRAGYRTSTIGVQVTPLAPDAQGTKRRVCKRASARHLVDLQSAAAVGNEAARATVARLGARSVASGDVPVVFAPEAGRTLVALVAQCALGQAMWRRSSWLARRQGARVASELVTIVDDPLIARAPGSRPFDGDGLASRRNVVIDGGRFAGALFGSQSARRLGCASTASAARGASAGINDATSNFLMLPGAEAPDAIIARTRRGLYVTELMGYGFNAVTGGLSRGAAGFWIEDGALAFPVEGVTISLDLGTLLERIDAVASDLSLRTAIDAPTFRVSSAVVAGAVA